MNSAKRILPAIGTTLICLTTAFGYARELPVASVVLDPDVILYGGPYPTISPDDTWIAYISKGFVSVCSIANPAPRKLFEVSETWTHVLARPENSRAGKLLGRGLEGDEYLKLLAQIKYTVFGLRWTHNSDGVVFGVKSNDLERKTITTDIWHASIEGTLTKLLHLEHGSEESLERGFANHEFHFTGDHQFLVSSSFRRPLIWDVVAKKPRATCFLNLTPSPTSGRWIGIEKDTRQLVITDENFGIVKRFDETRPAISWGFKLDWSPDERSIVWRNQVGFDHYSNWEGFWMNLETGEKRELSGQFIDEQFGFTGCGGEFFRCGQMGVKTRGFTGVAVTGAHLTIVPEGDGASQDVWRILVDPKKPMPGALTNLPGNPPIRPGPGGELFAIGLPRSAGKPSGWIWHLIDREGNKWRFPGEDNDEFISPFKVVGFAEGGKTIVAHDNKRLFSFPVSAIKDPANKVE